MSTREITNSEDILDSRDIDKRIKSLEVMRDEYQDENDLPDYLPEDAMMPVDVEWTDKDADKWAEWDNSDEGIELKELCALRDDLSSDEWKYGVTLIRDSYFQEYAEELVRDIGDLPKDLPSYIESNINWAGVADDIQQDYTSAEFDGVTYWARSY